MSNTEKPAAGLRMRPMRYEDGPGIAVLSEQLGMGKLDLPQWRAQWEQYPFASRFAEVVTGWVLEDEQGGIQGFLGNMHQLYEIGGVELRAVSSGSWMIAPAFRGKALGMVIAFYKQSNVELYLNGSANQLTIQVMAGFKIPRIPIPDYAEPCFWAIRPREFALAGLRRKEIQGAALLSWPVGLGLGLRDWMRGSGRGRPTVAVERVKQFGAEFDGLWERLRTAVPRLRAVRTAAVLEWKYGPMVRRGEAAVLVAGPVSEPVGYAILVRRDASELGMEMWEVADLQAVGDDAGVYRSLILASRETAGELGAAALKLMTGTPAKRRPALELQPYTYQIPFWQLFYKPAAGVSVDLSTAEAWDFSRFDTY